VVATPAPVTAPEVQAAAQGERRRARPVRDAGVAHAGDERVGGGLIRRCRLKALRAW
jgi:hypothetical protein